MQFRTRTPTSVSLHALATVVGGGALGWLLGFLGGQIGAASDPTGWSAIGNAVLGLFIGVIAGSYGTAVVLGRVLRFPGSWAWAILGVIIGIAGLILSMRLWSESPFGPIVGVGVLFTALLVFYHVPWRMK